MSAHSVCTVCGVKLTAKNKISYRPNSCRDCELERKRLYSLKRKEDNQKRSKSTSKTVAPKKTKKTSVKAKPAKKVLVKSKKAPIKKVVSKTKAKDQEKREREREKLRLQKEREREKLVKQRERERLQKERERERIVKQREREKLQREKDHQRELQRREREKEELKKDREREKSFKLKEKQRLKEELKKDREQKRLERENEKEQKRLEREREKEQKKFEKEEAKRIADEDKKEKARRKKLLDMNIITDVPDYALAATSSKVKARRFGKKISNRTQIVEADKAALENAKASKLVVPFNPQDGVTGEILRAPSDTPWEGSNFKIVGGTFVNHTDNDVEESRGPTEDEVKAIIERIRLEHKTRKE